MAYDYRPTAARAATSEPGVPVQPARPARPAPPAPRATPTVDITVAALVEEFIAVARPAQATRRALRERVAPELGDMRVDDVRARDVELVIEDADSVEALYEHAIERGYVTHNPGENVRLPEKRGDYQPIALLPERILSLVLRIVVLLFVLFALVTITGSA